MSDRIKGQLELAIEHFIEDATRVHDFSKGDSSKLVIGEEGVYPSAAMLVYQIQKRFDDLFNNLSTGSPVRIKTTKPLLISDGKIVLEDTPLGDLIHNAAMVFTDLTEADFKDNGMLKGDRSYLSEEHINVMVTGDSATFVDAGSQLDGYYAIVSYLTK